MAHLYSSKGVSAYGTGFLSSWDMQNFLLWPMSTFVSFTSDSDGLSTWEPMLQQLVPSFHWAMVGQARFTAFALANTRAVRKEAFLTHHFTSVLKAQLCRSDMDSDLLLDSNSMDKSIGQEQQVV